MADASPPLHNQGKGRKAIKTLLATEASPRAIGTKTEHTNILLYL